MRSILRYVGRMEDIHIKKYLSEDIGIYIEPFAGSFNCGFNLMDDGFLGAFVLNDKDEFVYAFWSCVKKNSEKLYRLINEYYNTFIKNDTFEKDIEMLADSDDLYDRAAYEYLYSISNKFSNKPEKQKIQFKATVDDFKKAGLRLSRVTISNIDYSDVIRRSDTKHTIFLVDPPYNTKNIDRYYRKKPSRFNHDELKYILDHIKGECIVRYKKDDYIDKLYSDFKILFETEKNILGHKYIERYYTNLKDIRT